MVNDLGHLQLKIKTFFSETTGPIKVKIHVEYPQEGRITVCINDPGHMTKIACMPTYGKNLKKYFSLELVD